MGRSLALEPWCFCGGLRAGKLDLIEEVAGAFGADGAHLSHELAEAAFGEAAAFAEPDEVLEGEVVDLSAGVFAKGHFVGGEIREEFCVELAVWMDFFHLKFRARGG